jgi:hypothetical protein
MLRLSTTFVLSLFAITAVQAEWRAHIIPAPGPVAAIELTAAGPRIAIGLVWYRLSTDATKLVPVHALERPTLPAGALPDARVVTGKGTVARAWLARPTDRYSHGVLGDAIEAGSLFIELNGGSRGEVVLDTDSVFEDLLPRIVLLGGAEKILLVKSYLARGSALAVIDPATTAIIAETPPIGRPNAWLNPAGVADYDGDGTTDIAIVRQPHVLGRLELWSWQNGALKLTATVDGTSNHAIGSRALELSATADFDGDGHPDLAIPSLGRRELRLIAFFPRVRDIARIPLGEQIATNIAAIDLNGRIALVAGLSNGRLIVIRDR